MLGYEEDIALHCTSLLLGHSCLRRAMIVLGARSQGEPHSRLERAKAKRSEPTSTAPQQTIILCLLREQPTPGADYFIMNLVGNLTCVALGCLAMLLTLRGAEIKPPFWEKAETARWLAHSNIFGTLSTTSVHLNGQAWGQPKSFADGTSDNSTGALYFYDSDMDTSIQDTKAKPLVAFSLSAAQLIGHCNVNVLDPEDPRCARVVFSGKFVEVTDTEELAFAQAALFDRHPGMVNWPADHDWKVHKVDINEIWLIDIYGGASIVPVEDYYAVDMTKL